MNRRMRALHAALITTALVAAACGTQTAPERGSIVIPEQVVPDSIVPTDPATIFPTSEECLVAVGSGARILFVSDDGASAGLLNAGDIITEIDGAPIGSEEQLRSELRSRSVGDVITVAGTRALEPFAAAVTLGDMGSGSPGLGIVAESRLTATPRAEISLIEGLAPLARPIVLNNTIVMHDPVGGAWSPLEGIPAPTMSVLDGQVYSVPADRSLAIVGVGTGEVMPVNAAPFVIDLNGTGFSFTPSAFVGMLGAVGRTLIAVGEAIDANGTPTAVLYGINPRTRATIWSSPFTFSAEGNPLVPINGYRSPDGERIAVAVVEQDVATGAQSDIVGYLIYRENGVQFQVPGFSSIAESARVTGWHDNESLLFVVPSENPTVFSWDTATGTTESLFSLTQADATDLIMVEPVGDGRHNVLVYRNETRLIDVVDFRLTRLASRGCVYLPMGGLGA